MSIVVSGALAQRPGNGGHAWALLQYLLGFRRLGWDVLFLDRLEPDMCVDESGRSCAVEDSVNWRHLQATMAGVGLEASFALSYDRGRQWLGVSRPRVLQTAARSAFLLNVMGYLDDEELLGAFPRRVFLDIDPGFGQMWSALGLHDLFTGHDDYLTVGANLGQPSCVIPSCGINWIATPPPVVLDRWPVAEEAASTFTSVCTWRGPFGPIDYGGTTFGLRVHEFRRFLDLPATTGLDFEVALDIDPADDADRAGLVDRGWRLVDPRRVAGDPAAYCAYVAGSGAELMIAKNLYVASGSGWFSDRSVCYLASGRPVVAQDTGWSASYPSGEGLLAFSSPEEAATAALEVAGHWVRHRRKARELAEDVFSSDVVLAKMLANLGVA